MVGARTRLHCLLQQRREQPMLQQTDYDKRMHNCSQIGHVIGQVLGALAVEAELNLIGVVVLYILKDIVKQLLDTNRGQVQAPHAQDPVLADGHVVDEVVLKRLWPVKVDSLGLQVEDVEQIDLVADLGE